MTTTDADATDAGAAGEPVGREGAREQGSPPRGRGPARELGLLERLAREQLEALLGDDRGLLDELQAFLDEVFGPAPRPRGRRRPREGALGAALGGLWRRARGALRRAAERAGARVEPLARGVRRRLRSERLDAAELLVTSVRAVAGKAPARDVAFAAVVEPGLELLVDAPLVEAALINVLTSAVHEAPQGSTVHSTARMGDGYVVLEVLTEGHDQASGRQTVFDLLGEDEHALESIELDLAVAQVAVNAHHGELSIGRGPAGEIVYRIELPITH
jgi:hypothetical protein